MGLDYKTIMWAEMKPDVYGGESCDEVIPRLECYCDDDKSSDFVDEITLIAKTYPPGTRIFVEYPCCPNCGQHVEMCEIDGLCDFDWKSWCMEEYS